MKEENLRYVLAIYNAGSINKAADELFISHQSLQRSLQKMEQDMGVTLFKRTPKGVTPTLEGQELLAQIKKIVDDYDVLHGMLRAQRAQKRRFDKAFTFYASPFLRFPFVNRCIGKLHTCFPDIRLNTKMCQTLPEVLNDDSFYLSLTWEKAPQQNEKTTILWQIYEPKMYLVVSKNHPLAVRPEATLHEALQFPFVSLQLVEGAFNPLVDYCRLQGKTLDIALETDQIDVGVEAVQTNDWVTGWLETALSMGNLLDNPKVKILPLVDCPSLYITGAVSKRYYEANQDIIREVLNACYESVAMVRKAVGR